MCGDCERRPTLDLMMSGNRGGSNARPSLASDGVGVVSIITDGETGDLQVSSQK